ncbi:MAG: SAM-dependent methyltransferase, partial [Candidatus Omnitrophica bacterium]|nr:SAM-dependent methyltransferase [Candidatus Omnitrophota bacterium]
AVTEPTAHPQPSVATSGPEAKALQTETHKPAPEEQARNLLAEFDRCIVRKNFARAEELLQQLKALNPGEIPKFPDLADKVKEAEAALAKGKAEFEAQQKEIQAQYREAREKIANGDLKTANRILKALAVLQRDGWKLAGIAIGKIDEAMKAKREKRRDATELIEQFVEIKHEFAGLEEIERLIKELEGNLEIVKQAFSTFKERKDQPSQAALITANQTMVDSREERKDAITTGLGKYRTKVQDPDWFSEISMKEGDLKTLLSEPELARLSQRRGIITNPEELRTRVVDLIRRWNKFSHGWDQLKQSIEVYLQTPPLSSPPAGSLACLLLALGARLLTLGGCAPGRDTAGLDKLTLFAWFLTGALILMLIFVSFIRVTATQHVLLKAQKSRIGIESGAPVFSLDTFYINPLFKNKFSLSDLELLYQILHTDMSDLENVKRLMHDSAGRIYIAYHELKRKDEGRTVYLRLEQEVEGIKILRIKGVRPRIINGRVQNYWGGGFISWVKKIDKEFLTVTKGTPDKKGGMDAKNAKLEYEIMLQGKEAGFPTDHPVGWGAFKVRNAKLGFVIAGMEQEDTRLIRHSKSSATSMIELKSGKSEFLPKATAQVLYYRFGRAVRAYHDAGYVHRYLRRGNIGVSYNYSTQDYGVILRDLETSYRLSGSLRWRSRYRFLDLCRVISDLRFIHNRRRLLLSFLQGYFYDIDNDDSLPLIVKEAERDSFGEAAGSLGKRIIKIALCDSPITTAYIPAGNKGKPAAQAVPNPFRHIMAELYDLEIRNHASLSCPTQPVLERNKAAAFGAGVCVFLFAGLALFALSGCEPSAISLNRSTDSFFHVLSGLFCVVLFAIGSGFLRSVDVSDAHLGLHTLGRYTPHYDTEEGIVALQDSIREELGIIRDRPVTILIKGSPGTGKSTIIKIIRRWLEQELRKSVLVIDQEELPRDIWESFKFSDAYTNNPQADVVMVEVVRNMLPQDIHHLDIFARVVTSDRNIRRIRLEEREGPDELRPWGFGDPIVGSLMKTAEGPDYPDRKPDIIIDNTDNYEHFEQTDYTRKTTGSVISLGSLFVAGVSLFAFIGGCAAAQDFAGAGDVAAVQQNLTGFSGITGLFGLAVLLSGLGLFFAGTSSGAGTMMPDADILRLLARRNAETRKFLSVIPHSPEHEDIILFAVYVQILRGITPAVRARLAEFLKQDKAFLLAINRISEQPAATPDDILEAELVRHNIVGYDNQLIHYLWLSVQHLHKQEQIIDVLEPAQQLAQQVLADAFTIEELVREANYNPHWGALGAGKLPIPSRKSLLYPTPVKLSPVFGRMVAERLLTQFEGQGNQAAEVWELGCGRGHLSHDILAAFNEFRQEAERAGNVSRAALLRNIRYHAIDVTSEALAEARERNRNWIERGQLEVIEDEVEHFLNSRLPDSLPGVVLTYDFFDALPFEWIEVYQGRIRRITALPVISRDFLSKLSEDILRPTHLSQEYIEKENQRLQARYGLSPSLKQVDVVLSKQVYLDLRRLLAQPQLRQLEGEFITWTNIIELALEINAQDTPELAEYIASHRDDIQKVAQAFDRRSRFCVVPSLARITKALGRAMAPGAELLSFEQAETAHSIINEQLLMAHPPVVEKGVNPYCLLGEFLIFPVVDLDMWEAAGRTAGLSLTSNESISRLERGEQLSASCVQQALLDSMRKFAREGGLDEGEPGIRKLLEISINIFRKGLKERMVVMRKVSSSEEIQNIPSEEIQFRYHRLPDGMASVTAEQSAGEVIVRAGREAFVRRIDEIQQGPFELYRVGDRCLVLKKDTQVIAFIYFWMDSAHHEAILGGVFVSPAYRKLGLATLLVDEYFKYVIDLGATGADLLTNIVIIPEFALFLSHYGFEAIADERVLSTLRSRRVISDSNPPAEVKVKEGDKIGLFFAQARSREQFHEWARQRGRLDYYEFLDAKPESGKTLLLFSSYRLRPAKKQELLARYCHGDVGLGISSYLFAFLGLFILGGCAPAGDAAGSNNISLGLIIFAIAALAVTYLLNVPETISNGGASVNRIPVLGTYLAWDGPRELRKRYLEVAVNLEEVGADFATEKVLP